MRIIVPPLVRPVELTGYAPELVNGSAPVVVWVWVNPPARVLDQFRTLAAQGQELRRKLEAAENAQAGVLGDELGKILADLAGWYAVIWSQHPDQTTHWTAEDVRALAESETDPGLSAWLRERTWDAIGAHRAGEKKA